MRKTSATPPPQRPPACRMRPGLGFVVEPLAAPSVPLVKLGPGGDFVQEIHPADLMGAPQEESRHVTGRSDT